MTIAIHGSMVRGELSLDIDLELEPGLTIIAGPNGAGKTSLLRTIAGLEGLDTGCLALAGRTVDCPSRRIFVPAHQRPVAIAFQDHRLFPHLSLLGNIAFPLRRRGIDRATAQHRARTHLDALGIADVLDARPDALSVGQRQRAALARALATPAEVLLLDEPLASIDEPSRPAIRALLRSIDRTTIWVTHDSNDLDMADAHISMTGGSVGQTRQP